VKKLQLKQETIYFGKMTWSGKEFVNNRLKLIAKLDCDEKN